MNFSTKNVEAPVSAGSKYLSVGINDGVILQEITAGASSKKGTPFLEVVVAKGDDSSVKEQFYMSEAAQEKSQQKIIHLLVDGLGVDRAVIDAAGEAATSLDNYAARLNKLIPANKTFRIKFTGEQYDSAGTIKTAKRIGFIPFAEASSVSPSKLRYDANSSYDFKKLPVPDASMALAGDAGDSLPF